MSRQPPESFDNGADSVALAELLARLCAGDSSQRKSAAEQLAELGEAGRQALLAALASADEAAAAAAAWTLADAADDPQVSVALVAAPRHPSPDVRAAAASADLPASLEAFSAWMCLRAAETSPARFDDVAQRIAQAVESLGPECDEVLDKAGRDLNPQMRCEAMLAASFRPARSAYDLRLKGFNDASPEVRRQVLEWLEIQPSLAAELARALRAIVLGAICGGLLFAAFAAIVAFQIGFRAGGFGLLIALGAGLGAVIAGIGVLFLRQAAREGMPKPLPRALVPTARTKLIECLHDANPAIRSAALAKVELLGQRTALEELNAAESDVSADVRAAALRLSGRLAGRAAQQPLTAGLRDASPQVRAAALEGLGSFAASLSNETALPHLADADPGVRQAAAAWLAQKAYAIGRSGGVEARAQLLDLLKAPDDFVRCCAVQSLRSVGAQPVVPELLDLLRPPSSSTLRQNILLALEDAGDLRAVPVLIELLHDRDVSFRQQCIRVLGALRAADAVPAIIPFLADTTKPSDNIYRLDQTAAEALRRIDTPAARAALAGRQ